MAGIVEMEDLRLYCRVDGEENDEILQPLLDSAERYILEATGMEAPIDTADPRLVEAIKIKCFLGFRPNEDVQNFLKQRLTMLINQLRCCKG